MPHKRRLRRSYIKEVERTCISYLLLHTSYFGFYPPVITQASAHSRRAPAEQPGSRRPRVRLRRREGCACYSSRNRPDKIAPGTQTHPRQSVPVRASADQDPRRLDLPLGKLKPRFSERFVLIRGSVAHAVEVRCLGLQPIGAAANSCRNIRQSAATCLVR